jgi:hypothetical protein
VTVSASHAKVDDRWSDLSRTELIALGRAIVIERLENLGCTVQTPSSRSGGKLDVETPSGRSREVFVSTSTRGRLRFLDQAAISPRGHPFAAIALLAEAQQPDVYLVPSTEWRNASPPLKDRDNVGKAASRNMGSQSLVHHCLHSSSTAGMRKRRGRIFARSQWRKRHKERT